MNKIYDHFSCKDFVLDDDFRAWVVGEAPENNHLWSAWLHANPAQNREVEKARRIVLALQPKGIRSVGEDDIQREWKRLEAVLVPTSQHNDIVNPLKRIFSFFNITAAAAVLLVFFFAGRFLLNTSGNVTVSAIEQKTANGQQREIKLSDGTVVRLNAGSTITYPKTFSDTLREVTLSGEAFFSVAKNPKCPFIIHTGEIITRVLGTSFNVRAYPENEDVQIAVVEGKVAVNKKQAVASEEKGVCLTVNEMVFPENRRGTDQERL